MNLKPDPDCYFGGQQLVGFDLVFEDSGESGHKRGVGRVVTGDESKLLAALHEDDFDQMNPEILRAVLADLRTEAL